MPLQGMVSSQEAAEMLEEPQLQDSDLVPQKYEGAAPEQTAAAAAGLEHSFGQVLLMNTCRHLAACPYLWLLRLPRCHACAALEPGLD